MGCVPVKPHDKSSCVNTTCPSVSLSYTLQLLTKVADLRRTVCKQFHLLAASECIFIKHTTVYGKSVWTGQWAGLVNVKDVRVSNRLRLFLQLIGCVMCQFVRERGQKKRALPFSNLNGQSSKSRASIIRISSCNPKTGPR